jgi:hypothetical protein
MHAKKVFSDSKENKKLAILECWSILIEKMCRVSARRLSIYNFVWGLLKATKKVYLIPQKRKNKDTYGFYPIKFANSTQKHKKIIKTPNQPIEIKKISN